MPAVKLESSRRNINDTSAEEFLDSRVLFRSRTRFEKQMLVEQEKRHRDPKSGTGCSTLWRIYHSAPFEEKKLELKKTWSKTDRSRSLWKLAFLEGWIFFQGPEQDFFEQVHWSPFELLFDDNSTSEMLLKGCWLICAHGVCNISLYSWVLK